MNKKIAATAIILVAIIITILLLPSMLPINQVKVRITYNGSWVGAINDAGSISSWSGTGNKETTLTRTEGSWTITANAIKADISSNTLTIEIVKMDGTILKSASTSLPSGIATVTITIS